VQKLLLEIARCPLLEAVLDDPDPIHPCAPVVLTQWQGLSTEDRLARWRHVHQLPEPWVGHLQTSQILFVSSNPSISGSISPNPADPPPGLSYDRSNEDVVARYESAFDRFILDGIRSRGATGPTRFWIEVRSRARELIGNRPVEPGRDYVLTEVVRCKSKNENGVPEALSICSGRYLERTLMATAAPVVVFLGTKAEQAAWDVLGVPRSVGIRCDQHVTRHVLAGTDRLIGFLPHPNHRGPRTPGACWHPEELARVRAVFRGVEEKTTA
jgi:hypothetical protein